MEKANSFYKMKIVSVAVVSLLIIGSFFSPTIAERCYIIDLEKYVWDGITYQDADNPTGPYLPSTQNPVIFKFMIKNTGGAILSSVVLTDTYITTFYTDEACTIVATFPTTLAINQTKTYYGKLPWVAGQHTNTATATDTCVGISDTDWANYFGTIPCINIIKYTNDQDANDVPGPNIPVGGVVTWKYVVTNCGNVNLSSITVTDNMPGVTPVYVSGDTNIDSKLQTTETWIYQATGIATAGQYSNIGTVTGTPLVGSPVSDTDPSHYYGSQACINIVKYTNDQDANDVPGPNIPVGGVVTWKYVVTNCGTVDLSSITVTDNMPGVTPVYVSGDTNIDSKLQTTETWIYQATGIATAGQYSNIGTVTGTPLVGSPVSDTDPSHYYGSQACINIVKYTNDQDANDVPGPNIPVGGVVTWKYVVTNCGTVDLSSITVTDNMPGVTPVYVSGDTNTDGKLQTTETWIYQATGIATAGQYSNIGTVTGTPLVGSPVSDTDPSHYYGSQACINIVKYTNDQDANDVPGPNIPVGGVVTWKYVVTNCGTVDLSSITVTDNMPGVTPVYVSGDTNTDGKLQTTETWIYQATGIATAGQYSNIGTATGTPLVGSPVSDTDPSHYYGSQACINIVKYTNDQDANDVPGPNIPVGGVVTWKYVVTNCGNVDLSSITVTDNMPGVTPVYVSGDTNTDGKLQTTETWIYQATGIATVGQYSNIGTATGTPLVGSPVSDTDPSHYYGESCECQPEVWIDDNFNSNTPGWLITHFNIKQMALDSLESGGTAYVYGGIYYGDIIIDDIPCCDNTGITQKGEYGCFPIGESAIITGSEIIKVDDVTIKYLEYTPNINGSIIVYPDVCGTIIRCNKFNKDCIDEAIGVKSLSTCGVNAEFNWWGVPDGPNGGNMDDGAIADGEGVKVIGDVDVEPWLGIHAEINQPNDPTTVKIGDPVHFDASGSFAYSYGECCQNPEELPLQYLWDFGDGKYSANIAPIHIYEQPGTYEVTLTVDAPGIPGLYANFMYDWAYVTIHVTTDGTPLTANADGENLGGYETIVNEPLQLKGDAYGGNEEYTWHWNFGDQTADSNLQNPIHTYTQPGTYTVTLTVISDGETATDTAQVKVYDIDELFVTINDANTITGIETIFTASIKGGTPPYTTSWDFGDGSTSQETNPTHIYNNQGVYTLTVTVTDNKQKTAQDTAKITVQEEKIIQEAEIKEVKGGLGIKATIDAGDNECYWEINVDGKFILSGGQKSGTINPNEQKTVKLGYTTIALGIVYITVTAENITKEYKAFALGPYYFSLKEL